MITNDKPRGTEGRTAYLIPTNEVEYLKQVKDIYLNPDYYDIDYSIDLNIELEERKNELTFSEKQYAKKILSQFNY